MLPLARPRGADRRLTGCPGRSALVAHGKRCRKSITVSWTSARDNHRVARYQLYRKKGKKWVRVKTTTARKATVRGLNPRKRYKFRVRAIDASGNIGPYSLVRGHWTAR